MEYIKIVLLGIIQGITEWLPISSTGHLILFNELFPLNVSESFESVFMVVVQLGSILAVVVLYFEKLWPFKRDKKESMKSINLWLKVLVASLPAAVVGLLLDDIIDSKLSSPYIIALALFVYGVLYIYLEKKVKIKVNVESLEELSYLDALKMGAFQMLALIPGTSRSGSTILGGLISGISRPVAAEFSFFMALPVMAGASLLRLLKHGIGFTANEWVMLLIGSFVAFLVSLAAIKALVGYVRKHDFAAFGVYRVILSIIVVLFFTLSR
ncbi:MAG: undecaprenyl-diphosphate phosphatase [Sphaerochaetaceae bacterium]|nr:undecaprenyl-diphosphate phosphatase [Sphaerochaetaceae bacterium]